MRSWRLVLAVVPALLLARPASADLASGTWTGEVEARGNYYWERSTRVIAPAIGVSLESPDGVRLHADYLVDSITSASQAAGTLIDRRFTEVRHDVGLGVGREFDFDAVQLDLGVRTNVSSEPDYLSTSLGTDAVLSLNQRATLLRLSLTYVHDDVGKLLRGADRVGPGGRDLSDRGQVGELDAVVTSLGISQILTPELVGDLGYDLGYLEGFLANPYRQVPVMGNPVDETHPGTRWRHTLYGRLAYHVRPTGTSLHALYRAYVDSWDIAALSPEARVYQEIGPFTTLRLRYRFYTQTRAFFYRPPEQYTTGDTYVSADPKMSEFHSSLVGLQLQLRADFLEGSSLDGLRGARLDMSFDYIWNTNRYGNGVISQIGLRVPF